MATIVVSAPGKVLLTGAYVVLERPNPGLVLSTSARFYTVIQPLLEELSADSVFWSWATIKVVSPQLEKCTSYKLLLRTCELKDENGCSLGRVNFVEDAIQYGVATALAIANRELGEGGRDIVYNKLLHGLQITILGSNDFYSFRKELENRGLPLKASTLESLPPFSPVTLNQPSGSGKAPEVAKTGLGSSASMTTAIVGGLLEFLGVADLNSTDSLDVVHAASQAAHCHAQGKVGSGFDVSAAVYGSQKYVRFSPRVLQLAMDPFDENGKQLSLSKAMIPVLHTGEWDAQRSNFALPPSLYLMLGEPGHGGSDTPSMVGQVNAWRKRHSNAEECWNQLLKANENVENGFLQLKRLHGRNAKAYGVAVQACSDCQPEQWKDLKQSDEEKEVLNCLVQVREHFTSVRTLLKRMGDEAQVPIEPASQTELLNETMNIPGVLFAGVPGAGGYDAVFAITLSEESKSRVEKLWSERSVLTLTVSEDPRGVRVEECDPRHRGVQQQLASIQLT